MFLKPTTIFVAVSVPALLLAQDGTANNHGVEVSQARHDVSPPLRSMRPVPAKNGAAHEKPLRPLPPNLLNSNNQVPDAAVQTSVGPYVGTTNGLNFPGIGYGDYGFSPDAAPPDTNGAVGATQYVQWVNESFAVFDKSSGNRLYGPVTGNTLWSGFGGGCEANNDGDPIVRYDKQADRWVMTQFSVSTVPYLQCVAVSMTSDATGRWYRYAFSYGNTQFPDYPKLGVWVDAYYVSYNIFNNGSTWAGSKVCAFDRAKMLTGDAATQQCFQLSTSYGGLLPADLDGKIMPPPGSPAYFLNYGTNKLNLWKFHVDWGNSANTTLQGPTAIGVANFNVACGGGACIPQPGTSQQLDSLADRLMYRLAYRNLGGNESMVVNHSVAIGTNKRKQITGIRWYELRKTGAASWTVYQQGTFSPDSTHRWMGSIAMDKIGNIAMGYSASSASVYPAIRYTGRIPSDALGTMETENSIITGGGSQQRNLNRWGDYSSITLDPADDCTFWYTTEYLKSSGTFNWSTRIASFKFPSCH